MAKDRLDACVNYEFEGGCTLGREGTFHGYCQRCDKYQPRKKQKHINRKKEKLAAIQREVPHDEP